jgi:hypothetical protein
VASAHTGRGKRGSDPADVRPRPGDRRSRRPDTGRDSAHRSAVGYVADDQPEPRCPFSLTPICCPTMRRSSFLTACLGTRSSIRRGGRGERRQFTPKRRSRSPRGQTWRGRYGWRHGRSTMRPAISVILCTSARCALRAEPRGLGRCSLTTLRGSTGQTASPAFPSLRTPSDLVSCLSSRPGLRTR